MRGIAIGLVVLPVLVLVATWLGYPTWLRMRSIGRKPPRRWMRHEWWPSVTIVVVVYNAEARLRELIENLLSLSYPGDRRRILVVSDASTDFTDAIVRLYAHRGVDLLRIMRRQGVARATNFARRHVRNDIVVAVDPEVRVAQSALTALIAPFADPSVGVTYGHELAIDAVGSRRGRRESPYTRYERMLRDRESRVYSTVSARRSLNAMRGPLYLPAVPAWANADFLTTLRAAEGGYRAVHVNQARCVLTRPKSLRRDYSRTVTAVTRDVVTLLRRPYMLNPRRYGAFAWSLLGHKLGRWLTPWALALGFVGLLLLAPVALWARVAAGICLAIGLVAGGLSLIPARTRLLRSLALPGHIAATTVAIAHASLRALKAGKALRRGLEPALG